MKRISGPDRRGSDWGSWATVDQNAELELLRKELAESRARERKAHREAEKTRERFDRLLEASQKFTNSLRDRRTQQRMSRRRIAAQHAIDDVLAEARDLADAATDILKALCKNLGWQVAVLWMPGEPGGGEEVLRCDEVWQRPGGIRDGFLEACRASGISRGEGPPGRSWERNRAVWSQNLINDDGNRLKAAAAEGLRDALAFPINAGNRPAGVIELLGDKVLHPDKELLYTVGLIGRQLGQFVERQRVEKEREEFARKVDAERALFAAVLRQMPAGVFVAEPSGGFLFGNEEAEYIYGRPVRSILECGRHVSSYPEGRELPWEDYPLVRSLERGEVVSGMEHHVHRPDGTKVVVIANSAPVRDEEGRLVAAVESFVDITRLKGAERALRDSESRFRTVIEQSPLAIQVFAPDGTRLRSNEAWKELWGLKSPAANIFEDERLRVAGLLPCLKRGAAGHEEITEPLLYDPVRIGSGEPPRWLRAFVYPIRDEAGRIPEVTLVLEDFTRQKQAAWERERLRSLEVTARAEAAERKRISRELHDRVAHSMGVVYQSLQLYEVLVEGYPARAGDKLNVAKEMARRSLEQIRSLSTELRRSETEKGLTPALQDLLEVTVPDDVHTDITVSGTESLLGDQQRGQIYLILREAIRNAVSHSGCSSIAVGMDIASGGFSGYVEDDGVGFDGDEGAGDTDGTHGGLGLRSIRERTAQLEGTVDLYSPTGGGVGVCLRVPLYNGEE